MTFEEAARELLTIGAMTGKPVHLIVWRSPHNPAPQHQQALRPSTANNAYMAQQPLQASQQLGQQLGQQALMSAQPGMLGGVYSARPGEFIEIDLKAGHLFPIPPPPPSHRYHDRVLGIGIPDVLDDNGNPTRTYQWLTAYPADVGICMHNAPLPMLPADRGADFDVMGFGPQIAFTDFPVSNKPVMP